MYACRCVHVGVGGCMHVGDHVGVSGCVYVGVRGLCHATVHCSRQLGIELVYAIEVSVGSKDFCKGVHFTTFTFLLR